MMPTPMFSGSTNTMMTIYITPEEWGIPNLNKWLHLICIHAKWPPFKLPLDVFEDLGPENT